MGDRLCHLSTIMRRNTVPLIYVENMKRLSPAPCPLSTLTNIGALSVPLLMRMREKNTNLLNFLRKFGNLIPIVMEKTANLLKLDLSPPRAQPGIRNTHRMARERHLVPTAPMDLPTSDTGCLHADHRARMSCLYQ